MGQMTRNGMFSVNHDKSILKVLQNTISTIIYIIHLTIYPLSYRIQDSI